MKKFLKSHVRSYWRITICKFKLFGGLRKIRNTTVLLHFTPNSVKWNRYICAGTCLNVEKYIVRRIHSFLFVYIKRSFIYRQKKNSDKYYIIVIYFYYTCFCYYCVYFYTNHLLLYFSIAYPSFPTQAAGVLCLIVIIFFLLLLFILWNFFLSLFFKTGKLFNFFLLFHFIPFISFLYFRISNMVLKLFLFLFFSRKKILCSNSLKINCHFAVVVLVIVVFFTVYNLIQYCVQLCLQF